MELSDLQRQSVIHSSSSEVTMTTTAPSGGLMSCPVLTCLMTESAPHPPQAKVPNLRLTQRVSGNHSASYYQLPTPPPSPSNLGRGDGRWDQPYVLKLPRRVRLWNFWARTRVAQRGIMACVVIWIALIVYKTGLVDHLTGTNTTQLDDLGGSSSNSHPSLKPFEKFSRPQDWMERKLEDKQQTSVDEKEAVKHGSSLVAHHDMESWRHLSHTHWPKLLGFYNISLRGRYITILPTIHLSKLVSPDSALSERHPLEVKSAAIFSKYSSVDTAGDKQRLAQAPNQSQSFLAIMRHRLTVYPRTKTEFILTLILGFASTILLTYALMMLYKCMCPRDYARWRSSWGYGRRRRKRNSPYFNQIQDAVPLVLAGHTQEVECIACDGPLIISSCLGGQLRVWDSSTGECRTVINRKTLVPPPPLTERNPVPGRNTDDSDADLYAEYHEHIVMETPSSEKKILLHPPDNMPPGPRQQYHSSSESEDFTFSDIAPDLSSSISTNFSDLDSALGTPGKGEEPKQEAQGGYDFASRFEPFYKEHRDTAADRAVYYDQRRRDRTETTTAAHRFTSEGYEDDVFHMERSHSSGMSLCFCEVFVVERSHSSGYMHSGSSDEGMPSVTATETTAAAIWCLACQDCLIVAGCGNGRIEFWDGLTGHLKYLYQEGKAGVTAVCFVANRVIAARLSGDIDFLELETFQNMNAPRTPTSVSRLYNRAGHFCRLSSGHVTESHDLRTWDDIIHVTLLSTAHAHQRPINLLQTEGGRVVSGGQDHTLKVYRLEDSLCLYTLHGHSGAITALHLDVMTPLAAASGAEDGTVRLWDLLTGACVHKLDSGHHGRVTALTCTLTHVVSAGVDNRLCIWERWNGHLLHWLHMVSGHLTIESIGLS
ncbi:hypothetical protein NP493_908g00028 [Ridgeia piscesae]|uniref:SCAP beta-propeller domain-containing protein n=1 Tax=Ridgeia piscesae TaxID=27915 RepID=A0AAD9KKE4_RIDPI|nr:hypothetical protein NP493_908g00028 [Ridgeia piscesae]